MTTLPGILFKLEALMTMSCWSWSSELLLAFGNEGYGGGWLLRGGVLLDIYQSKQNDRTKFNQTIPNQSNQT